MNDALISFETAVLAKEKGFSEFCNRGWCTIEIIGKYINDRYENNFSKEFDKVNDVSFCPLYEPYYLRPTQSLLQKWLRENHKLHINLHVNQFGYGFHYSIIDLKSMNCVILLSNKTGGPNYKYTYEEALEQGLKQALNLIK